MFNLQTNHWGQGSESVSTGPELKFLGPMQCSDYSYTLTPIIPMVETGELLKAQGQLASSDLHTCAMTHIRLYSHTQHATNKK